jgi:hypothetical protein
MAKNTNDEFEIEEGDEDEVEIVFEEDFELSAPDPGPVEAASPPETDEKPVDAGVVFIGRDRNGRLVAG